MMQDTRTSTHEPSALVHEDENEEEEAEARDASGRLSADHLTAAGLRLWRPLPLLLFLQPKLQIKETSSKDNRQHAAATDAGTRGRWGRRRRRLRREDSGIE